MPSFHMSLKYSALAKGIVKVEEIVQDKTREKKTAIESAPLVRSKLEITVGSSLFRESRYPRITCLLEPGGSPLPG